MKKDPRIDEMIAKAPDFARPVLTHLRRLMHTGCPDVEETIKWGRGTFVHQGRLVAGMAVFKAHCGFGFWDAEVAAFIERESGGKANGSSGQFGKLTRVEDLPAGDAMLGYIRLAVKRSESGAVARPRPKADRRKPEAVVPDDLAKLLSADAKAAAVFHGFSPSHRREYIEWINEAKRAETRQKRLTATMELLVDGRSLHWKYQ